MSLAAKVIGVLAGVYKVNRKGTRTEIGAAPVTADAAADAQMTATTTAQKALVLQGQSGQTANLQEWQKNDGTVTASMSMGGTLTATDIVEIAPGTHNVILGSGAGAALLAGSSDDTLVGYNAGNLVTTGSGNSFFGSGAGSSVTTGANNSVVGNAPLAATSSFRTVLGWGATDNGDNTVTLGRLATDKLFVPNLLTIGSGASTWNAVANTANALKVTDGTTALLTLDTRNTASGVTANLFGNPAPTIASAAGVTYSSVGIAAYTLTLTGTTGITNLPGLALNIGSPTVTNTSLGLTITTAATMTVGGPLPAGNATITNTIGIDVPTWVTNGTTASAIRIAAPSGATTNYALDVISGNVGLASASSVSWNADTFLVRDAANVLALRNGTSAQILRVYESFTDASNGRWVSLYGNLGGAMPGIYASGNGTGGTVDLWVASDNGKVRFAIGAGGGVEAWNISSLGHFVTPTDNTYDLGASGATRPRTGYFATSVVTPLVTMASGNLTLSTTTSGTLAVTSAGALNLIQAAASTWTLTSGMTASGGAFTLNDSSNFNVKICTGTSTGTVGIGNSAAGALTIASGAASTLTITGSTWTMATTGANNIAINPGAGGQVTIAPSAVSGGASALAITPAAHTGVTAEVVDLSLAAHTLTITGGYATQRSAVINSTTFSGAFTVTTAIGLQVNGPLPGTSTLTNTVGIDVPTWATNGTTASGIRIAAPTGGGTNWALNITSGGMTVAGASTVAGLLTASAGATISGAAITLNASSNFNTNINTGSSTGTVAIGNSGSTAAVNINGNAASTWTVAAANLTISTTTSGTLAVTSAGVLTLTGAGASTWSLTSGALVIQNSAANLTIQTQTSGTLALTGAAALNITAAAASTWACSGGALIIQSTSQNLTVQTITSGTIALTSAGAVNMTSAAASTWTHSGGAFAINATSQNVTIATITSGTLAVTSAGALNLTAAAASTWALKSATANAVQITDGTNAYYAIDTRTTTSGVNAHSFSLTAPTIASAAGVTFSLANLAAYTASFSGTSTITNLPGVALNINSPTISNTSTSVLAVTTAAAVTINGPREAAAGGGSLTITNSFALDIPTYVSNGSGTPTVAAGLRVAAPSGATTNYALQVASGNVNLASASTLSWSTDAFLVRDAANTIAVKNSTTGQTFNIYGTTTGPKYLSLSHNGTDGTVDVAASSGKLILGGNASDIQWGKALVALGGGSAPTLGTIGGSGPATAGQNAWMQVKDSTGAAMWVPVWK